MFWILKTEKILAFASFQLCAFRPKMCVKLVLISSALSTSVSFRLMSVMYNLSLFISFCAVRSVTIALLSSMAVMPVAVMLTTFMSMVETVVLTVRMSPTSAPSFWATPLPRIMPFPMISSCLMSPAIWSLWILNKASSRAISTPEMETGICLNPAFTMACVPTEGAAP